MIYDLIHCTSCLYFVILLFHSIILINKNAACISVNCYLIPLINSVSPVRPTCDFPRTLTRLRDFCLNPAEKSHIPLCLLRVSCWLWFMLVGHAAKESQPEVAGPFHNSSLCLCMTAPCSPLSARQSDTSSAACCLIWESALQLFLIATAHVQLLYVEQGYLL